MKAYEVKRENINSAANGNVSRCERISQARLHANVELPSASPVYKNASGKTTSKYIQPTSEPSVDTIVLTIPTENVRIFDNHKLRYSPVQGNDDNITNYDIARTVSGTLLQGPKAYCYRVLPYTQVEVLPANDRYSISRTIITHNTGEYDNPYNKAVRGVNFFLPPRYKFPSAMDDLLRVLLNLKDLIGVEILDFEKLAVSRVDIAMDSILNHPVHKYRQTVKMCRNQNAKWKTFDDTIYLGAKTSPYQIVIYDKCKELIDTLRCSGEFDDYLARVDPFTARVEARFKRGQYGIGKYLKGIRNVLDLPSLDLDEIPLAYNFALTDRLFHRSVPENEERLLDDEAIVEYYRDKSGKTQWPTAALKTISLSHFMEDCNYDSDVAKGKLAEMGFPKNSVNSWFRKDEILPNALPFKDGNTMRVTYDEMKEKFYY